MTAESFVGIDVAKASLDLAVRPAGTHERVPNDEAGIAQLVARLQPLRPALVVLEATGGLEVPLAGALAARNHPGHCAEHGTRDLHRVARAHARAPRDVGPRAG